MMCLYISLILKLVEVSCLCNYTVLQVKKINKVKKLY